MKRIIRPNSIFTALVAGAAAAALAAGCAADPNDPDVIADEIELENGGLDMLDEAPMFGEPELFAEVGADVDPTVHTDAMENDSAVTDMATNPDAAIYSAVVLWGQMPFDPDVEAPRLWNVRITASRGAVLVRRRLRMENATDRVHPRTDRLIVDATTATWPHNDGLALRIIDPTPEATDALVLTFDVENGPTLTASIDQLLDAPTSVEVDARGNRVTAVAKRRLVDVCEGGFIRGRWHQVAHNRGRFAGGVANDDGERIGHIRGVYGVRLSGERVFFGKYINRAGEFKGLLGGHYRDGRFAGRWISRGGEHGVLGGRYREALRPDRISGHFLGRFAETSCNVDLGDADLADRPSPGDAP